MVPSAGRGHQRYKEGLRAAPDILGLVDTSRPAQVGGVCGEEEETEVLDGVREGGGGPVLEGRPVSPVGVSGGLNLTHVTVFVSVG